MIFRHRHKPPELPEEGRFLVVGLGNPGRRYAPTRHNIGFRIMDLLAGQAEPGPWRTEHQAETRGILLDGCPVVIAKPQTFMNESGRAVKALMSAYRIELARLLIVSDDLDLPFGRLRLRPRGSPGGHNGLRSVSAELGTQDYARLRVGIGRPTEGEPIEWVLTPFTAAEEGELPALCAEGVAIIRGVLSEGILATMNRFNGQGAAPRTDAARG